MKMEPQHSEIIFLLETEYIHNSESCQVLKVDTACLVNKKLLCSLYNYSYDFFLFLFF